MKITVWLKEGELHARRLAAEMTGEDRACLLAEADHFQAALAAVEERDSLRKDTERYYKLRNGQNWPAAFSRHDAPEPLRGAELDAATDAATAAASTPPR